MANTNKNEAANDFPPGIGAPAHRALAAAGITRLEQLTTLHEADLLKLHGVGPKAIRLLRGALAEQGLAFASPKTNVPD